MNNCSSRSQCVYRYDNKYLVFGFATNTLTGQQQGLNLLVTDTFGIELQEKQFYHPDNYLFYANAIRPFDLINDRYVLFSGILSLAFNHHIGVLAKINLQTLDTMWVKSYNQPGDSCELFTSTYLADSSMLVVGERYFIQNNFRSSKPFLMKVDKNGNYKWHKYLYNSWNSYSILAHRILKIDDNSFIVGGSKRSVILDGFFLRTDTNATLYFDVGTTGIQSNITDVIRLNDNTLLGVGNCKEQSGYKKKLLYNFNFNTGTKIKSPKFNIESNGNGAQCATQKVNGVIYVGGASGEVFGPGSYNHTADVLKVNSNLDSIATFYFPMPSNSQLAPYHISCTKDGGFIAALFHGPNSGTPKNWLIKADSTGCFEVNCPINNGIEEAEKENGELKVWPNPARNFFNLLVGRKNQNKDFILEIYNSAGNLVRKEAIVMIENQFVIDINELESGLFLLHLSGNNENYNQKLIIQK